MLDCWAESAQASLRFRSSCLPGPFAGLVLVIIPDAPLFWDASFPTHSKKRDHASPCRLAHPRGLIGAHKDVFQLCPREGVMIGADRHWSMHSQDVLQLTISADTIAGLQDGLTHDPLAIRKLGVT